MIPLLLIYEEKYTYFPNLCLVDDMESNCVNCFSAHVSGANRICLNCHQIIAGSIEPGNSPQRMFEHRHNNICYSCGTSILNQHSHAVLENSAERDLFEVFIKLIVHGGGDNPVEYVTTTKLHVEEPKVALRESVKNRSTIIQYIEKRIEEALKEEKGSGCIIPKLDPFAKEVTQFDVKMPKVSCAGQDWVQCYLSECHVILPILDSVQNIICTYRDILYHSDHERSLGPPRAVTGNKSYNLTDSDHVKVDCTGKKGGKAASWSGYTLGFRTLKAPQIPTGRDKSLNVLIIGFDSTSKDGFIRRMPKSYEVLTEELGALVLNGYNIVGDGTPAALFPILTGHTELELPDVRKKSNNDGHLDDMPFIFKYLKEDGYRTAYFEDMPWIGTFQYRFNGFLKQPADHYLRAFYMEESGNGKRWSDAKKRYCVGDRPQYYLMLDITKQFFKQDSKKFCFTFIADITHDDFNMISTADDSFAMFLKEFKRDGHMDDTLVFVMGDHGPRYAKVRATLQGKQEERLPLMAILVPPSMSKDMPDRVSNLERNTEGLTTPFDIHATYLDAIGLNKYKNNFQVPGAEWPRSVSLFNTVPVNRTCGEAGIEPHWCACLRWQNVSIDEPVYRRAVNALVDYINALTEGQRSKCALRSLSSVAWVMRQSANSKMLSFKSNKDVDGYIGLFGDKTKIATEYFQVKVTVSPGRGVYEASMKYLIQKDQFEIKTTDISRTNAYGDEPSCISATHPHLNMYCYCND